MYDLLKYFSIRVTCIIPIYVGIFGVPLFIRIPYQFSCPNTCILTFRFDIKSSLFKSLCTLARLCEGTPLQPLRLKFLSHPRSTLQIAFFSGMTVETNGFYRDGHAVETMDADSEAPSLISEDIP